MPLSRVLSNPVGGFVDRILRGVGQVMLQNNPITGLLFLLGIFINDWVSGLYALLGTVVSTETALLFGAPDNDVRQGLYGFNGTLIGLGLTLYLRHDAILLIYVIVASMFAAVVTAAIQDIFGAQGHALTAPFVIMTWIFIAAVFVYGRLHGAPALGTPHLLTEATPAAAAFAPIDALTGILNGLAQVMLQQNIWTGVIFLIALAVNSRISCAAAVLGSAIAVGVAWSLGAAPSAIREGLYGFNAVLTAIALGGLFFLLHRTTVLLAILGVCVSTILYGGLVTVLSPLGLPALTAPFVVTTWLCLLARVSLTRLQALSPAAAMTPEGNLTAARQAASERQQGRL
ncbi:MAG: urea transporter [Stellaceae bacterium]